MDNIPYLYNSLRSYGKSMWYLVLFIGSLIYIARRRDKVMLQVLVWPAAITFPVLLILYNLAVTNPLFEKIDLAGTFSRFFWIIPIIILGSYMMAVLIQKQQRIWGKLVVAIMLLMMVRVEGGRAILLSPSENIYKVPDEVIEVADFISEIKEQENPIVLCDCNLYYYLRQYDPTIVLVGDINYIRYIGDTDGIPPEVAAISITGELALIFISNYEEEVNAEVINTAFEEKEVNFWIVDSDWYKGDEYLQALDIQFAGNAGKYDIYRCR